MANKAPPIPKWLIVISNIVELSDSGFTERELKEKIHLYAPKPSLHPIFEMIENRKNWHGFNY